MTAPDESQNVSNYPEGDGEEVRADLGNLTQNVSQSGKYPVNLGQGRDVKIGDTYNNYYNLVTDQISSTYKNFSDPRPSIGHWQGRETELEELQKALMQPAISLVGVTGLGGFGKSTLVSKLYSEVTRFTGKFWADVAKQSKDFNDFAARLIAQQEGTSPERVKDRYQGTPNLSDLVKLLQNQPYLLVIDNLEVLLQPDGHWENQIWENFFCQWLEYGDCSKLLVTSRERPISLGAKAFWYKLEAGLSPVEGAKLLKTLGIKGADAELQEFVQSVGGYPLSLILTAGLLKEEESDPEIRHLIHYTPAFEIKGDHRGERQVSVEDVFTQSFNRLSPKLQRLLTSVSVFKGSLFNHAAAVALLPEENILEQELRQLVRRSLLQESKIRDEHDERQFQLQLQVLNLVERKAGDLTTARERAAAYYRSRRNSIIERVALGTVTANDIDALRRDLTSSEWQVGQLGKYSVNIGQGQDIHIGDRIYQGVDAEVVKEILRDILKETQAPPAVTGMTAPDDLSAIFDRIASGKHTEVDLTILRQLLTVDSGQNWLQLGQYNVNIGQRQDIYIGDRIYQSADAESIKKIFRTLLEELQTPPKVDNDHDSL